MENGSHQVRVMLWSMPRTLSTAFTKCMSHLDNVSVISEPYTCAMMYGPESQLIMQKKSKDAFENLKDASKMISLHDVGLDQNLYTFKWVKESLLEGDYPGKDIVFCKDMSQPVSVNHSLIPKGYRHAFMIRHPLKLYKSWSKVLLGYGTTQSLDEVLDIGGAKGYAYADHLELYEYLISSGIEPDPVIIDADELQSNPEGILRKFCQTLDIKYTDKLLSWEAGDGVVKDWVASKIQLQCNKLTKVYQNAFDSTCFKKLDPMPLRSELEKCVLKCADETMPIYMKMFEKRLRP
ncbi:branched-chain-amino-acid aminotransferase-like protein 2 [Anneissia japonica]|uniref:branched-chain-amino-acid aminotransferase-like protein 2 n=1 Tax=Anneissia japonica TaxID=1529436 RepID=UPI0014255314|nr:branched-chain-amino-acid aminotransferase-like protein 2 [Anneissia japonica]